MSLLLRLKRIWKLSEPPAPRQWTWNGEPVSKEFFDSKMGIEKAVIIKKDTSVEDFLNEN